MPATKSVVLSSASARSRLRTSQASKKEGGVRGKSIDSPIHHPPPICSGADQKVDLVESLLAATESLSLAEKKALVAKLSLELTGSADASRDQSMWASAIYQALSKAVPAHGYGELLVRKQMSASNSWCHVRDFMQASDFSSCSVVERQGIYNLLADLLLRYVRRISARQGLPVTLKLIASCSAHVGATFESEFPGYLSSGLGKVIVRQMLAHPAE